MNKKAQLVLNIIAVAAYLTSLVGFFFKFIYGWILGIGNVGTYKGYELALNFEGFPQNLATLFPLVAALGSLIYCVIVMIKKARHLKDEPKETKGSRMLVMALFFILVPLICLFLCLSTVSVLGLPKPKRYGGYYMGEGPYIVSYSMIVGGLLMFICDSGIFKVKGNGNAEPVKEEAKPQPQVAKPVQPEAKVAPQVAKPQPQAKPAPQVAKPAPQVAKPQAAPAKPAPQARPVAQPQAKPASKPVAPQKAPVKPAQPAAKPVAPQKAPVKK